MVLAKRKEVGTGCSYFGRFRFIKKKMKNEINNGCKYSEYIQNYKIL